MCETWSMDMYGMNQALYVSYLIEFLIAIIIALKFQNFNEQKRNRLLVNSFYFIYLHYERDRERERERRERDAYP